MKRSLSSQIEQYLKKYKWHRGWYRVVTAASIVVVFITVYLLILPAITMERETICQKDEHVHTDACYVQEDGNMSEMPLCGMDEHTHGEECYPKEQTTTKADTGQATETIQTTEVVQTTDTNEPEETAQTTGTGLPEETVQTTGTSLPEETVQSKENTQSQTTTQLEITTQSKAAVQSAATVNPTEKTISETAVPTSPIVLQGSYIAGAKLYYRPKDSTDGSDWIEITKDSTNIPGDASVKLEVKYKDIPIDKLLEADGRMTYTLPDLLKNPQAAGAITSEGKNIGVITANGHTAAIAFDKGWLETQKSGGSQVISGDFYVTAQFDLTQVPDTGKGQIVVGDVTIDIDFEDDVHANASDVNIEKTAPTLVTETDGGDYLEYTLTVSVPEESASVPEVKVVDSITEGISWIESYDTEHMTIPEGTKVTIIDGTSSTIGKLEWTIGAMQPGESKSWTYRVKLKERYTGSHVPSNGTITNAAEVYSKTYKRDDAVTHFTPKAGMTISKMATEYTPNESGGGGSITYTIWVKAYETNTYTLDNVKIQDSFSNANNMTNPAIRDCLQLDETSFKLYQGGQNKQNGAVGLTELTEAVNWNPHEGQSNPVINHEADSFDYYVGSMKPGECKTLIYTVNITDKIFTLGNDTIRVKNRAMVMPDDTRPDGNKQYNAYNCNITVGRKIWNRKLHGTELQSEKTVLIPENHTVFSAPGIKEVPSPSEFIVPAGSYQYQVVVNEAGDWDVSSATLQDSLGKYLAFSGYMRVDAFSIDQPSDPNQTDEQAVANLKDKTPVQTVWLKVDDAQEFNFKPNELELNGNQAYLLTYYAKPKDLGSNISVTVANDFNISGDVIGPGGKLVIDGIHVSTSVTVQGQIRYSAEKQSWYYEQPKVTSGDWSKGTIYWAIKVNGNKLPMGMQLRDIPITKNNIRNDSVAAVYKGVLPETGITSYKTFEELDKSGMTKLSGNKVSGTGSSETDYQWKRDNNSAIITFNKEIPLDESKNEAVYIIIKTEPAALPQGKRETLTCENKLQSSGDNGSTWGEHNTAQKIIYGNDGCFKETGGAYQYDGTGWTILNKGQYGDLNKIIRNDITEPGTYVEWRLHLNYDGGMSGTVQITDQLPKGMIPVYVRYFWLGDDYVNAQLGLPKPTTPIDQDLEGNSEWMKSSFTFKGDGHRSGLTLTCISYYNPKTNQIRWKIADLASGGAIRDKRAVEFQVLCRVADEGVLTGGSTTYVNQFDAVDEFGVKGDDTAAITITKDTLSKRGTYNAETNGGTYPFEITVNHLGEDLVSGADTITLVDELSRTLILDTSSIKVKNSKTNEEVTGWSSSIEQTESGQILKLVLPDNIPLTITYNTTIDAAPGQAISFSNVAHWEGYASPVGGNISEENFKYTAGGTAGSDTKASFKLMKLDQANIQNCLPGAEFKLEQIMLDENGEFVAVSGTEENKVSDSKTTSQDGVAEFSVTADDRWMKFNTIYRLTEIKAPDGFVLDRKPYYFAIAKKVVPEAGGEAQYPTELAEWTNKGVHIHYGSAQYIYQAYNHRGEAAVSKKFQKEDATEVPGGSEPDGSYRFGLYETVQTANSTISPLQIITISYLNGKATYKRGDISVDKPNFINLELNKPYYVYELDDNNQPIVDGTQATINGRTFTVTYESNSSGGTEANRITVVNDNQESEAFPTVTVINKEKPFSLPKTGGVGTYRYLLGGVMFIAASFILLYRKIKAERRT